ncbi:uncharacterized protein LOC127137277 [Lathyrus oleraceus]|uniref:uncharacterized protein LOC127137277 n=1 Tax=Pisum sativum TaxID=3888 RepID=UPI0021D07D3C|nr:uncharacterized protein LOC127137277 [Pisum sativum]
MTYAKLYPSLVVKNLIQPINPPHTPKPLPWWFKPDLHCAIHHGAPDHDIENCYHLKHEVQKLIKSSMVSFEVRMPNVKANPFPTYGNASMNMVDGCPGNFRVFDVRHIRQSLVEIHRTLCLINDCEHEHDGCVIHSVNSQGCVIVNRDIQKLVDEGVIQSQQSRHMGNDVNVIVPVFKTPERVPLPAANSVISIAYVIKVTRSGRVFGPISPKVVEDAGKKANVPSVDIVNVLTCQSGESSRLKDKDNDNGDVLRLIKTNEFNIVEQLLQTPSKISMLSLLMNSEAHRKALQKVLEQAYIEYDVTVDQFDHIVTNITSCKNLSFRDEELPEEGRNHNLALHISMNCKEDALSNVLVDTGSPLNMLLKSTLTRLSYQGAPMRYNGVVVKVFDGSLKTLIREVDLPVKIGQSEFQITFQKLKFVKNRKLIIIGGEKALLVSHPSSFTYVQAEEEVGMSFQALSIAEEVQRTEASMSFLKDAQEVVQAGGTNKWSRVVEVVENKNKVGLGFQQGPFNSSVKAIQQVFRSGGTTASPFKQNKGFTYNSN